MNVPLQHHFWKDDALENEVEEIINLCSAIRQVKSQYQITGKHDPKSEDLLTVFLSIFNNVHSFTVDLFTDDDVLLHKLRRFLDIMLPLSMVRSGEIWSSKGDFENIDHMVRSQATDNCSFGMDIHSLTQLNVLIHSDSSQRHHHQRLVQAVEEVRR